MNDPNADHKNKAIRFWRKMSIVDALEVMLVRTFTGRNQKPRHFSETQSLPDSGSGEHLPLLHLAFFTRQFSQAVTARFRGIDALNLVKLDDRPIPALGSVCRDVLLAAGPDIESGRTQ